MNRLLLVVDEISTWVGKTAGWCIVILTFTTSYEVFMRYLFLAPTEWAFDASYILYGTLFMLAGAYTLARNGHVRGDFIYRSWTPRTPGQMGPGAVLPVLLPGHVGLHLCRLRLRQAVLAGARALLGQSLRTAGLSFQDVDPDRRRADGDAGHRRGHPLRHVHPHRRVAQASARRRGARQGHPREGRARRNRGGQGAR